MLCKWYRWMPCSSIQQRGGSFQLKIWSFNSEGRIQNYWFSAWDKDWSGSELREMGTAWCLWHCLMVDLVTHWLSPYWQYQITITKILWNFFEDFLGTIPLPTCLRCYKPWPFPLTQSVAARIDGSWGSKPPLFQTHWVNQSTNL